MYINIYIKSAPTCFGLNNHYWEFAISALLML